MVAVGEVETGFYEEGAEAFAVVGGVHGEDFEDLNGGRQRGFVKDDESSRRMDLRGRGLDACEIVGFEMAKWLVGNV